MPIYPQYNPSACSSCQQCLEYCPKGCIYFDPLYINSDECILCDFCLPACPEGVNVLASGSKLLGKEWVWFVQPQELANPKKTTPQARIQALISPPRPQIRQYRPR